MGKVGFGPKNPNWKGGKSIASNGYVLIKNPGHPLADVRGYVYEHRLVAQEKAGRPLVKGEIAHHRNEIKADNAPTNIELCATQWEHRALHRTAGRALRNPGEANPIVECACGCGQSFETFDSENRLRRFISGHNPQNASTMDAIVAVLTMGPATRQEIAALSGITLGAIATALSKLRRAGRAEPINRGTWMLKPSLQVRQWPK